MSNASNLQSANSFTNNSVVANQLAGMLQLAQLLNLGNSAAAIDEFQENVPASNKTPSKAAPATFGQSNGVNVLQSLLSGLLASQNQGGTNESGSRKDKKKKTSANKISYRRKQTPPALPTINSSDLIIDQSETDSENSDLNAEIENNDHETTEEEQTTSESEESDESEESSEGESTESDDSESDQELLEHATSEINVIDTENKLVKKRLTLKSCKSSPRMDARAKSPVDEAKAVIAAFRSAGSTESTITPEKQKKKDALGNSKDSKNVSEKTLSTPETEDKKKGSKNSSSKKVASDKKSKKSSNKKSSTISATELHTSEKRTSSTSNTNVSPAKQRLSPSNNKSKNKKSKSPKSPILLPSAISEDNLISDDEEQQFASNNENDEEDEENEEAKFIASQIMKAASKTPSEDVSRLIDDIKSMSQTLTSAVTKGSTKSNGTLSTSKSKRTDRTLTASDILENVLIDNPDLLAEVESGSKNSEDAIAEVAAKILSASSPASPERRERGLDSDTSIRTPASTNSKRAKKVRDREKLVSKTDSKIVTSSRSKNSDEVFTSSRNSNNMTRAMTAATKKQADGTNASGKKVKRAMTISQQDKNAAQHAPDFFSRNRNTENNSSSKLSPKKRATAPSPTSPGLKRDLDVVLEQFSPKSRMLQTPASQQSSNSRNKGIYGVSYNYDMFSSNNGQNAQGNTSLPASVGVSRGTAVTDSRTTALEDSQKVVDIKSLGVEIKAKKRKITKKDKALITGLNPKLKRDKKEESQSRKMPKSQSKQSNNKSADSISVPVFDAALFDGLSSDNDDGSEIVQSRSAEQEVTNISEKMAKKQRKAAKSARKQRNSAEKTDSKKSSKNPSENEASEIDEKVEAVAQQSENESVRSERTASSQDIESDGGNEIVRNNDGEHNADVPSAFSDDSKYEIEENTEKAAENESSTTAENSKDETDAKKSNPKVYEMSTDIYSAASPTDNRKISGTDINAVYEGLEKDQIEKLPSNGSATGITGDKKSEEPKKEKSSSKKNSMLNNLFNPAKRINPKKAVKKRGEVFDISKFQTASSVESEAAKVEAHNGTQVADVISPSTMDHSPKEKINKDNSAKSVNFSNKVDNITVIRENSASSAESHNNSVSEEITKQISTGVSSVDDNVDSNIPSSSYMNHSSSEDNGENPMDMLMNAETAATAAFLKNQQEYSINPPVSYPPIHSDMFLADMNQRNMTHQSYSSSSSMQARSTKQNLSSLLEPQLIHQQIDSYNYSNNSYNAQDSPSSELGMQNHSQNHFMNMPTNPNMLNMPTTMSLAQHTNASPILEEEDQYFGEEFFHQDDQGGLFIYQDHKTWIKAALEMSWNDYPRHLIIAVCKNGMCDYSSHRYDPLRHQPPAMRGANNINIAKNSLNSKLSHFLTLRVEKRGDEFRFKIFDYELNDWVFQRNCLLEGVSGGNGRNGNDPTGSQNNSQNFCQYGVFACTPGRKNKNKGSDEEESDEENAPSKKRLKTIGTTGTTEDLHEAEEEDENSDEIIGPRGEVQEFMCRYHNFSLSWL